MREAKAQRAAALYYSQPHPFLYLARGLGHVLYHGLSKDLECGLETRPERFLRLQG